MQTIILAAGIGTRLKAKTDTVPKALIEIGGKSLLEYSFEALLQNGINDVIIVVGHLRESIMRKFGTRYRGLSIDYVQNKKYAVTGSMYSLAMVKNRIDDDILLLESDLLYEPRAIKILLDANHRNAILVTELSGSGDEVYICVNDQRQIIELGKDVCQNSRKNSIGELAGISRFESKFLGLLFAKAREDFERGALRYHYEECVFRTSQVSRPVYAVPAENLAWIEIDTEKDLQKARERIYPRIKARSAAMDAHHIFTMAQR